MTTPEILALVATVVAGYGMVQRFLSKAKDPEIQKLGEAKAKEEGKIEALKEEQATLKQEVTEQEAGKSEEAKVDFWRKYAKKDPNGSTDSK